MVDESGYPKKKSRELTDDEKRRIRKCIVELETNGSVEILNR